MLKARHWIGVVEQGKEAETGIGIGCGARKEPTEQGHGCCCCCTSRKKMSLPCKPSQGIYLPCCCGEDRREPPYHVRILLLPMVLNPNCVQVSGFRLHACTHHVKQPWRWRREPPCLCCLSSSASYCQVLLLTVSSAGSLYALSLFHACRNATPPPFPWSFSVCSTTPFAPWSCLVHLRLPPFCFVASIIFFSSRKLPVHVVYTASLKKREVILGFS
jgi:hypothetical protein